MYQLDSGFTVTKANSEEFGIYYLLYGHGSKNIWFPTSQGRAYKLLAGLTPQYWIEKDCVRVGGFVMGGNFLGFLFLIPPFDDEATLLKDLIKLVKSEGDSQKPIKVGGIYPNSYLNFQRLGFQTYETERIMIRPTAPYEISWGEQFILDVPKDQNKDELVNQYYTIYSKSSVPCISDKNKAFYESILKEHIPIAHADLSTLIYDKNTGELVASCLVFIWEELPYIADIVVNKSYEGQGLATKMVKKVLNNAYGKYPAVRLTVRAGNSAEGLYHGLGFISGVESSTMIFKVSTWSFIKIGNLRK